MPTLTITLPLPARELSPNARCHWRRSAEAKQKYRALAATLARSAKPAGWKQARAATVRMTFYFADARKRDKDNLLASMKAAIDGIVGTRTKDPLRPGKFITENNGILVDDDKLTLLPIEIDVDPFDQYVRIEIITKDEA